MKIFSTLLLLTGAGAALIACQKDTNATPAPTKTEYLTASAWVHESSGIDLDKNGTIDFPFTNAVLPDCLFDNKLTFKKDYTAVADEGATKCNPADPQTSTFTWSFGSNETSLNISSPVFSIFSGNLKIVTLTDTKLTLSKDTTYSGQNVLVIANLKHP